MSHLQSFSDVGKPLPSLDKDDQLPPPPSYSAEPPLPLPPPPLPPPKVTQQADKENNQFILARSDTLLSTGSLDPGLTSSSAPPTPTTPTGSNMTASETKPRKNNPLVDLIETEKTYVEQLTGIIRKIASAWSRSNLPPTELDSIFRSVEAICKANRSLLSELKEIGTSPSSPMALGDLLMRWVDDLEGPYTAYCYHYCTGFDVWDPVLSNQRLQPLLQVFSETHPPPPSLVADSDRPIWSLDTLFLIPKIRLKYYKRLYTRLLKSTVPGKNDHKLLVGALEKLDNLLSTLEERASLKAGATLLSPLPSEAADEVVIDMQKQHLSNQDAQPEVLHANSTDAVTEGAGSSVRGSSFSSSERLSRETTLTSNSQASRNTMNTPLVDLERRLSTERTLDIFTMTPKVVRLQISPATLKYSRELRFSIDVVVRFTPQSTGVEVVHQQGHVFLLSDLFLVCEKMSPEERSKGDPGGPDMWLCYPPLAGKVLRVQEASGRDNALEVHILRKETLILEAESPHIRDYMMVQFRECIDFAHAVTAGANQPPPFPLQHPNGQPAVSIGPLTPNRPPRSVPPNGRSSGDITSNQGMSPINGPGIINRADGGLQVSQRGGVSPVMAHPAHNPTIVSEGQTQRPEPQRAPSLQDPSHASLYPRSVSAQPFMQVPQNNANHPYLPRNGTFGPPNQDPSVRAGPSRVPPAAFNHPTANPGINQPFSPAHGLPPYPAQARSGSEPVMAGSLRKSPSTPSLTPGHGPVPAMPPGPNGYPPFNPNAPNTFRNDPYGPIRAPQPRPMLPSALNTRAVSLADPPQEPSPPNSPVEERQPSGPVTSTISAQMKCKVFLQQQHAQWKSLGAAKLKLYNQHPTNVKQLVVEADNKGKSILISTIVLTDGVERVGKTGVAVELSDKGTRTGIIYMIQLRNETSAGGLFDSLLEGSDRAGRS